jgi:anaphase-promoting complex subunit 7
MINRIFLNKFELSIPEVRYQMHICHLALKQSVQALLVLQGIPAKLRSVKVNMALGKLYVMNGLERPAISAFKEVIRECPLALEAILALIKLGVSYVELVRLIFNGSPSNSLDW